jgi:tRNA dimethylallyltransferase
MPKKPQKSALLIAGPTASGKSALALRLAQERNGVIINSDSMQVYRELRILTARPTVEEEALVPHRLFGQASGMDAYSVARWRADAIREMEACWEQGLLPIICGGTGLYFRALEEGLAELPPIPGKIRERWRNAELDLHVELSRRDSEMAVRLNPGDRQRLARALEVIDATGRSLSEWQKEGQAASILSNVKVERLFLSGDRNQLYERAERRFDEMMEAGALEEVRTLPPLPPTSPLLKAIGVPELQAYLNGHMSLGQAVADAKTATRRYIKRQLTWWRPKLGVWTIHQGNDG